MEDKRIRLFLISLLGTFIITRIDSPLFHDRKNYGTKKEKSKTISGWLRKRTNFEGHHIHFVFLMLLITSMYTLLRGLTKNQIIFYGISLSLIADQIVP